MTVCCWSALAVSCAIEFFLEMTDLIFIITHESAGKGVDS